MALLTSIQDFKNHTDVSIGVNINSLLPATQEVATLYIYPYFPRALYEYLDQTPTTDMTSELQHCYALLQAVMAKLTVAQYAQRSEVSLTASGLQRTEGSDQKSAYRYQSTAFVESYRQAGLALFDELLTYCDANAAALTLWADSPAAKRYRSLLIKNGQELATIIGLRYPQFTYLQLVPDMVDVEEITFGKLFGGNYKHLKARMQDPSITLTQAEQDWLKLLKHALAHSALQKAVPRLQLVIGDSGLLAVSWDNDNKKDTRSLSESAAIRFKESAAATAAEYISLAKAAYSALLATTPAIPGYTTHTSSQRPGIDNSEFKSVAAI